MGKGRFFHEFFLGFFHGYFAPPSKMMSNMIKAREADAIADPSRAFKKYRMKCKLKMV
jgi:hypothetical protein